MKVCITGDSILMTNLPKYEGLEELKKTINSADVKVNNLEMTVSEFDCCASSYCGSPWLTAPFSVFEDITDYGFNCYSFANNHTMDYSYDGMFSTLKAFERKGLPVSGAGKSLKDATKPAIVKTDKGTFALFGITATSNDAGRAGDAGHKIPARPGVNMIRHSETFLINEKHMQAIKEIAEVTRINGRQDNSKRGGYTAVKPGIFSLGPVDFKLSEVEGKSSAPNKLDMKRMEEAIKDAVKKVDHVVVYYHSHETKALEDEKPDYFMEEFARSCIDWGADCVVGSGTHQIKAIEVYKGKPIFYSIANFIFQSEKPQELPLDYYERYNADPAISAHDAIMVRSNNGTRGLETEDKYYRSMMPILEFEGKKLVSAKAKVLELHFAMPDAEDKGMPRLADEKTAKRLFGELTALSEEYKTGLSLNGNEITIDLNK